MELKDKVVLITGGGGGLGLGIARGLAREGCRVAITDCNEASLQSAVAEFDGHPPLRYFVCDVTNREQVGQLFAWLAKEVGPLDILVNSVGLTVRNRHMAELRPCDWDHVLAVNLTGAYNCMYAALPGMRERRGGLIVNISSIAGKRVFPVSGPAYCASKFALTALGTCVGLEEREYGIHVTNIHPGEVVTAILDQRPEPVPPEKLAQMLQPEDIAAAVVMVAKLPPRALVPELIITPLYQGYV